MKEYYSGKSAPDDRWDDSADLMMMMMMRLTFSREQPERWRERKRYVFWGGGGGGGRGGGVGGGGGGGEWGRDGGRVRLTRFLPSKCSNNKERNL